MVNNTKTVIVGLSGGVDSSVAAWLLKAQGYHVIGVMLKLWSEGGFGKMNQCCSLESAQQARRIAAKIDIPFYLIDASDLFFEKVVQPFISGYVSGQTPNPCAVCNPAVRWAFLRKFADGIGADMIATGHYANLTHDSDGNVHLYRGYDLAKDQSYVLSRLPLNLLHESLFPLGGMTKIETRTLAMQNNLPSATKPDSQDICFIGDGNYKNFLLRQNLGLIRKGAIQTMDGVTIGEHEGLPFYTIGQRKGICIAAEKPYYVVAKDVDANVLIVGAKEALIQKRVVLENVNVLQETRTDGFWCLAQFRYKAKTVKTYAERKENGSLALHLDEVQSDITPGQIGVLYTEQGEVLCSGEIADVAVEL